MDDMDTLIYEDWLNVKPQLLWALERRLDAPQASAMGCKLTSYDQTAWYIMEGEAVVKNERGEVCAKAGEWLFPAQGIRRQDFSGSLWFYSINFRAKWWEAKPLFPMEQSRVLKDEDFPAMSRFAMDLCKKIEARLGKESWYLGFHRCSLADWMEIQRLQAEWLEIYGKAMSLLEVGITPPSKRDPRFEHAHQLMENHTFSEKFTVEDLAAKVGLSRRQLERIYQETTGVSPMTMFEDIKIEKAKKQLLNPSLLIKEVAYDMGFSDISNFNRWFFRLTKLKPGQFRESYQRGV